ncbi:MAG: hypothetical protein WA705_25200 [Candidatus Ozemobacteraceae bacterium]
MFESVGRRIRLIVVCIMLCLSANPGSALDLNRLFPQKLDGFFFAQLRAFAGNERAVFITIAGQERTLYLRYVAGQLILQGSLTLADEVWLAPDFFKVASTPFSPLKQDGSPLYCRGTAYSGIFPDKTGGFVEFMYVPHQIAGKANDAFVCDCGYLQLNMPVPEQKKKIDLQAVIEALFAGKAGICQSVKLNRYYLYRDNFFGPVDEIDETVAKNIIFGPLHKATRNKGVSDYEEKMEKDHNLVIRLLAHEKFLLSQDKRLKLGKVPGQVKIPARSLDNTDIGSGQNQFVFLSVGSGINYFDDPWLQPRENIPCPRLIFHRDLCGFKLLQVFPTYSIEPREIGEGRLKAINSFQAKENAGPESERSIAWPSVDSKISYFSAIEEALCRYGLTNNKPELTPGFTFADRLFRGNLVNNEIRVFQSVPVRDMLTTVIVPGGNALAYGDSYKRELENSSPHWEFNCGIHYRRLFADAIDSTDKGFRATWLMLQLRESHPALYRVIRLAQTKGKTQAFLLLADKVANMAARTGRDFFLTSYFRHFRSLDDERNQRWLDYLEAYRTGDTKRSDELFQRFSSYYQYLESIGE